MRKFRFLLLLLGTLLLCSACKKIPSPEKARVLPDLPGAEAVGTSVKGNPIERLVLGTGPEVVMIMATIHGNENAGTPLVLKLADILKSNPALLKGKTVVLLPVVNPDGFLADMRYNARGIDLNRNFAASNREANRRYGVTELSEPESKLLVRLLEEHEPSRIVSIHQPLVCVDWDGPGQPLAQHMAAYTDLPAKRLGSRPGSLGSYAGEDLGIPIITYELRRGDQYLPDRLLWQKYGTALLAAVTYPEPVPWMLRTTPWMLITILLTLLCLVAVAAVVISRRRHMRARKGVPTFPQEPAVADGASATTEPGGRPMTD